MTGGEAFVFGRCLNGTGGAEDVDQESAANELWLHFDYSLGDLTSWLTNDQIQISIIEGLAREDTRPRSVVASDGILLVLRGINTNPGSDPEDMVSLRIWYQKDRIITVRQRRLLSVQDLKDSLDHGQGPDTIAELFVGLVERIGDRIADFVDQTETSIEDYEQEVETTDPTKLRPKVNDLRRQTAMVRRFLAPQREALRNLYLQNNELLTPTIAMGLREQLDRMTRYVEDIDLIRERTFAVQDEIRNKIAQDQNARMYVLSIVAAIFLPITFITGVFGMNVAGVPGVENANAFSYVIGAMGLVVFVVFLLFRFKRWF